MEVELIEASALKDYSLFGGLLPDEIESIRPLMNSAFYEAGTEILREGEPNDRIHFILEGRVEILKRDKSLIELREGDTFGEMEFLDVMPAAATVRALIPSTVATISNHALHELSEGEHARLRHGRDESRARPVAPAQADGRDRGERQAVGLRREAV